MDIITEIKEKQEKILNRNSLKMTDFKINYETNNCVIYEFYINLKESKTKINVAYDWRIRKSRIIAENKLIKDTIIKSNIYTIDRFNQFVINYILVNLKEINKGETLELSN